MAKLGEEDTRWIVSDLGKQGQNVNDWHWTEKDSLVWVRGEIEKEFPVGEPLFRNDVIELICEGIEKLTGEAVVANRKGKLKVFYSMKLSFKVKGIVKGPDGSQMMEAEGIVKLPYFCDTEDNVEDYGFELEIKKGSKSIRKMFFKEKEKYSILERKLGDVISRLRKGGPILDSKNKNKQSKNKKTPLEEEEEEEEEEGPIKKNEIRKKMDEEVVEKILKKKDEEVKDKKPTDFRIRIKHLFPIPLPLLYECFTKPERMSFYTQSKCIVEKNTQKFTWYNGIIEGKIIKQEENKVIEMDWRFNDWKDGKYSRVIITFGKDEKTGKSFVQLVQRHCPEVDKYNNPVKQKLITGWKQRFFHKIGYMFGTKMSSRMFF